MKKVCLAVLPALTIVLELLPLGAVCIFATSPTERVKKHSHTLALHRLAMQILLHLLQPHLLLPSSYFHCFH